MEPSVAPLSITAINEAGLGDFAVMRATGSTVVCPGYSGSALCHAWSALVLGVTCWRSYHTDESI
jgi:hypothetical protein